MYAITGQKDFALATVTELRDYTENAISNVIKNYPEYSVIVKSPTSTGTEDFSYSQAGVPAIVASDVEFEDSNYDQNIYHSTMDSKLYGFNPEVFKTVHEIFTALLFDLDNTAVTTTFSGFPSIWSKMLSASISSRRLSTPPSTLYFLLTEHPEPIF